MTVPPPPPILPQPRGRGNDGNNNNREGREGGVHQPIDPGWFLVASFDCGCCRAITLWGEDLAAVAL